MNTPSLTIDEVRQVWEVEPERGFDGGPIGAIRPAKRPLLVVGPGVRQQQADRLAQLMARRIRISNIINCFTVTKHSHPSQVPITENRLVPSGHGASVVS